MLIAELILEYVKVLIWPLGALVAVVLYRNRISSLLDRISRARFPGGEVEFSQRVEELKEKAAAIGTTTSQPETTEDIEVLDLIRQNPAAGLAVLRMNLEREVRRIYAARGLEDHTNLRRPLLSMIRRLAAADIVPFEVAALVFDVVPLANRAIHGEHIQAEDAEELALIGLNALALLKDIEKDNF